MSPIELIRKHSAQSRLAAFAGYSLSGMAGFSVDLLLLFLLVERAGIHYVTAVVLAYLVGVTIHFSGCRWIVFSTSERPLKSAYGRFILIAFFGVVSLTAIVVALVEVWHVQYLIARIAAAATVGIISFFTHRRISFGLG